MSTAREHIYSCERLHGLDYCTCPRPAEPTEMKSLREMRESLAALVTEFRGLREDQQRMNGLLMERQQLLATAQQEIGTINRVLSAEVQTAISESRESAMRNHCQVADALKDVLVNQVRNGRKLDAIRKQRRGKRRK